MVESCGIMFLCTGECIHLVFQCSFCMNSLCENSCAQQSLSFLFTDCQHNVHLKQPLSFFRTFPNIPMQEEHVPTSASIRLGVFFRNPDTFLSQNAAQTQKQTINYKNVHNTFTTARMFEASFQMSSFTWRHCSSWRLSELNTLKAKLKAKYLEYLVLPLKTDHKITQLIIRSLKILILNISNLMIQYRPIQFHQIVP